MSPERLSILYVSHMPASPPRFGAQARVHGLMTQLARRHDLTAVMLLDDEFAAEECRRAMQAYCCEVVLVHNPHGWEGFAKRLLQLRSLASTRSFERLRVTVPALQRALDQVLRARRFDVVNLEFSFLGHCDLRQAPPGERLPPVVVDSHNIDYELARQYARAGRSLVRRLYAAANWRKLRREELGTYRDADGVYLCSAADERRLLDQIPGVRTTVIPNAADVEYYQPRPTDPPPDGRTVVFFGLLSYVPNLDGVTHFVQDIWPRISEGIEAVPGRDLLIEDQPAAFADAVNRLLADPDLAMAIGQSARRLVVQRYSWSGAARALEGFYRQILQVGS